MHIPKIIHFIWAGGTKILPKKNLKNIIEWKRRNPDFKIMLWVDYASTSELERRYHDLYLEIQQDGQRAVWPDWAEVLIFENISELQQSPAYNIVRYEIDRFNPNYGVSSDLLRYTILFNHGGVYFDSDVYPSNLPLQNDSIFGNDAAEHRLYIDTNSQGVGEIGNDALICTPHNPLMGLIMNIALNNTHFDGLRSFEDPRGGQIYTNFEPNSILDAYFMDDSGYRRVFTPERTGPGVVKNVVKEISGEALITTQEYQVHLLNKHTLRAMGENDGSWLSAMVASKPFDFDQIIACAATSITFEVQKLKVLRLPEYINQCYHSLEKEGFSISIENVAQGLIQALSNHQIDFQNVQVTQWNYHYHDTLLGFANNHSIDYFETSGLFPNEKNKFELLPELVDKATNKSESDSINMKLKCYLQYLEDGISYVHSKGESEGFPEILKYFQGVDKKLSNLILSVVEVDEYDSFKLTKCRQQLAGFSREVESQVVESSESESSSSFWRCGQREEQYRPRRCVIN